jgi:hypothetical protein
MRSVKEIKEEIVSLERLKEQAPDLAVGISNTIAGLRWVLNESPCEILLGKHYGRGLIHVED